MAEQNRERAKQKRRLRSRMLMTDDEEDEKTDAAEDSGESENDHYRSRIFWHRFRKSLVILIPVLIIVIAAVLLFRQYQMKEYTEYETVWETSLESSVLSSYTAYGTNVLRYGQDGAAYINSDGKTVWNQAYEMRSPMVTVNGDYVAVADQEGREIYICDLSGNTGQVTTALPVSNIAIAATGMVAVQLEEDESSYIDFYDKDGRRLDIELKLWMGGEGYPVAMALSPTGTQLLLSCVYADAGTMLNKLAFYNFSDVGEMLNERLAGGFEIGETVVPEVAFLSDNSAVAFTDSGLKFFSMQELSPKEPLLPEEGVNWETDAEIQSVFHDDSRVGVVTAGTEQGEYYHLYIFDSEGKEILSMSLDIAYTGITMSDYGLCIYNDTQCRLYNFSGQQKYEGELGGTINTVIQVSSARLIRVGDAQVAEVALK